MSDNFLSANSDLVQQWHQGIKDANRNNIFCHCRACGYEWIDSTFDVTCIKCTSKDVESISSWQFPDD
jgi:Zn finger protein HypA/HybF involved in hydrogenase expression